MPRREQVFEIGPRILDNYQYLRKLARTRLYIIRSQLLRNATRDELLSLVEIATHILSPIFNLTSWERRSLIPYAHYIRRLSRVRTEKGARRLIQKGKGVAFIPSLLIPIIAEVGRLLLSSKSDDSSNGS
jgi:hypothetical protein